MLGEAGGLLGFMVFLRCGSVSPALRECGGTPVRLASGAAATGGGRVGSGLLPLGVGGGRKGGGGGLRNVLSLQLPSSHRRLLRSAPFD